MPRTSAASALPRWLKSLRSSWVALAQGGTWVLLIVGGLLYPPPAGVQEQDAKLWLRVGQFVATAVIGILFVLSRKKGSAEYLRTWLLLSCLLLIFGVAAVIAYYHWQYTWTCSYARTRVIVGSEYTDFGRTYAEREGHPPCEDLLNDFAGQVERIWTRESILRRQTMLVTAYLLCVPLLTACILSLLQAIHCSTTPVPRPRGPRSAQPR